ncbi:MAG: hypothetical protein HQK76_20760 [Desulfobacterales bacterium]|nr:hypothetical protein [Desulfobacterales bacterium]
MKSDHEKQIIVYWLHTKKCIVTILAVELMILFFFVPVSWSGSSYYIANSGSANDSNPGTIDSPWKTFAGSIAKLTPGDTLIVRDGTYNEQIRFKGVSGTLGNPITVRAENIGKAIIQIKETDPAASAIEVYSDTVSTTSYITIEGFIARSNGELPAINVQSSDNVSPGTNDEQYKSSEIRWVRLLKFF